MFTRRVVMGGLATMAILVPTALAGGPTVKVSDNEFSKSKLDVRKGSKVKFKWDGGNDNPHKVVLRGGPKGVNKKKLRSKTGKTNITFAPKLKKPGVYDFLCLIHPDDMQIKINVRR